MSAELVIGVDPGVTAGIVALPYVSGNALTPMVVQCDHASARFFVEAITNAHSPEYVVRLAVEAFVVGTRATRSTHAQAGKITRALIAQLTGLFDTALSWPAATVKPWATDHRLYAAGLIVPTAGMNHARDAARHALYAAVHQGLTVDPLSAKAQA